MEIVFHEKIAELKFDSIIINSAQDVLDLIYSPVIDGADKIIIHHNQLHPAFFDLKTGLAGDVLQKFVQYKVQVVIVGNFATIESKSLADFIRESNRGRHVFFVGSVDEAITKLNS